MNGAHDTSRALSAALAVAVLAGAAAATNEKNAARAYLAASLDLTTADLDRIDRGQVVARTMDATDKREVAVFGVARVKITPEFFVERVSNIVTFKRDEAVLQIGVFGNPPALQDVSGLTLDEGDIRSLRACRVGDCGVQLSADAITRFRNAIDWQRADAAQQANGLMRRILVEYVTEYLKVGAAASMRYADRPDVLDLRREFRSLAEIESGGWKYFPALRRHLCEYSAAAEPGTVDLVYWSKEKSGRKAVVSVTHLAIARTAANSPAEYAIASKHIYGTHYFDASLGLTVLLRDPSAAPPAIYLAYVNRSRVDVFGGLFGALARSIVSSRARAMVSDQLARLQRRLERQFAELQRQ